eukprot:TRINITY_DN6826_c0_g3_i1.p1 TRINITY_DN6826_c0_g3~~TRINITY_DN6826_c0_g3_i1.p1  ORF type:complete len:327 (-),score=80.23 TRINITY_DN6826_c0_g3_i1:15-920(-)
MKMCTKSGRRFTNSPAVWFLLFVTLALTVPTTLARRRTSTTPSTTTTIEQSTTAAPSTSTTPSTTTTIEQSTTASPSISTSPSPPTSASTSAPNPTTSALTSTSTSPPTSSSTTPSTNATSSPSSSSPFPASCHEDGDDSEKRQIFGEVEGFGAAAFEPNPNFWLGCEKILIRRRHVVEGNRTIGASQRLKLALRESGCRWISFEDSMTITFDSLSLSSSQGYKVIDGRGKMVKFQIKKNLTIAGSRHLIFIGLIFEANPKIYQNEIIIKDEGKNSANKISFHRCISVSYTHLTLPTICSV